MIVADFRGYSTVTVRGLTQWDYGQDMQLIAGIDIPDGTEVQFYQCMKSSLGKTKQSRVRVPDAMLTNAVEITAYVYVRTADSGETVLTVRLPVTARQRPEDYVLPEYTGYSNLLPDGGEPGQVPVIQRNEMAREAPVTGRRVEWGYRADGAKFIDNALQLMSGDREIGERVRLPEGINGREVELRKGETAIEWRYTNENEWHSLVPLEDLKGPAGETPEFEIRDGNLYATYQS